MGNSNLSEAKRAKNDDFYTQLDDIAAELKYYKPHFKDSVIFCPTNDRLNLDALCIMNAQFGAEIQRVVQAADGSFNDELIRAISGFNNSSYAVDAVHQTPSNFVSYFIQQFYDLGVKQLICCGYEDDRNTYMFVYNGNRPITTFNNPLGIPLVQLFDEGWQPHSEPRANLEIYPMHSNGDFRKPISCRIRDYADVIVTNPPFSLFREFIAWLFEANKKFLVIGNMNAITYKEVFPLIKDNKLWLGNTAGKRDYVVPYATDKSYVKESSGEHMQSMGNTEWFTNLDFDKRHERFIFSRTGLACNGYKAHPEDYPKYDNYDAINIDKTKDIPDDYEIEKIVSESELEALKAQGFVFEILEEYADGVEPPFIDTWHQGLTAPPESSDADEDIGDEAELVQGIGELRALLGL